MIVFPAIDILQGRCVRMVGGVLGTERLISNDPLAVARDWELRGARGLHVVDLDAAFERGNNRGLVKEILQHVKIPVQVGGGVRTADDIRELMLLGAVRVIVGTKGVLDAEWLRLRCKDFPERLILALDARGEEVLVRGWREKAHHNLEELAREVDDVGLAGILYTNVSVEGKAQGMVWDPVERLVRATTVPIIYSGGVIRTEEIRHLREIGVAGVVLGTALYFGGIDFTAALAAAAGQELDASGAPVEAGEHHEGDRATKIYRSPTQMDIRVATEDIPVELRAAATSAAAAADAAHAPAAVEPPPVSLGDAPAIVDAQPTLRPTKKAAPKKSAAPAAPRQPAAKKAAPKKVVAKKPALGKPTKKPGAKAKKPASAKKAAISKKATATRKAAPARRPTRAARTRGRGR